jgi:hypothetical protein
MSHIAHDLATIAPGETRTVSGFTVTRAADPWLNLFDIEGVGHEMTARQAESVIFRGRRPIAVVIQ